MVSGQRDVQAQRQDGVAEAEWCGLGRSQYGKPFSRGFILSVRVNTVNSLQCSPHERPAYTLPLLSYPSQHSDVIMAEEPIQPTTAPTEAPNLDGEDEVCGVFLTLLRSWPLTP